MRRLLLEAAPIHKLATLLGPALPEAAQLPGSQVKGGTLAEDTGPRGHVNAVCQAPPDLRICYPCCRISSPAISFGQCRPGEDLHVVEVVVGLDWEECSVDNQLLPSLRSTQSICRHHNLHTSASSHLGGVTRGAPAYFSCSPCNAPPNLLELEMLNWA